MRFYWIIPALVSGIVAVSGCAPTAKPPVSRALSPASVSPNIVLIVADDQGWADLGLSGMSADVATPNLDRLAREGVRFTNAYATSPICNASRAGLITGNYQQRQGIYWYGGPGIHDASIPTLPEYLHPKGYSNLYVGKFHYGTPRESDNSRRDFPLRHGFDHFFGFEGGRKHYLHHQQALEETFLAQKKRYAKEGQSLAQGPMWEDDVQKDQQGFSTQLFGAKAREFIEAQDGKPFFLQLSFNAVHNFTHQLPADYLKKHGLKGYHDWDPATEEYQAWYERSRYPNNPEGRAHYLAQLDYLDSEIGEVLDYLDSRGLRESTVVIYLSDNGGSTPIYANNGILRGSKYTLYEGGIRIPMIVSWPQAFLQNAVSDEIVSALDLVPTVCALVGGCDNLKTDGKDIRALLSDEHAQVERAFLAWDTGHETALRKGRWKLKTAKPSSQKHAKNEMVEIELGEFLFDLEADPGEQRDLSKQFPEKMNELKADHNAWRQSIRQGL